jgi:hypothetical protein
MRSLTLIQSISVSVLFSVLSAGTVVAIASSPTPVAATAAQKLAALQSKGTAEIDRRLSNLTAATAKLAASTKLTAADKTALTTQVQDEITGLTALKAKLAAETAIAGARADVVSIVADYRVYVLVLPKTRLVASADRFAAAEDNLTSLYTKLKGKVPATDAASTAKLADMQSHIAAAQTISGSLASKLLALQPTGYNANHAVLMQYRATLKTAQADLVAARDDAKAVRGTLK